MPSSAATLAALRPLARHNSSASFLYSSVYLALLRAGLLNCVFMWASFRVLTLSPLSVKSMQRYEASFVNRHRPGRNPRNFLFFLIRRGGSQVRLRAGSQGYAGESCRRLEGRQGEGPRDVQQGRGRLQGPRPLCLLRERLRRRHDRASLPERRAPPEHRREEGLSPRKSDHGEGRGREDPKRDLLVASPGNQDAAREAHLLHEGRGPDLRSRILQAVGVSDVHALGFFAGSDLAPYPEKVYDWV